MTATAIDRNGMLRHARRNSEGDETLVNYRLENDGTDAVAELNCQCDSNLNK